MPSNRLAHEKSPYLLQHADNPVDWYPWGDAAFKKAKNENKPIFLSIGYSTCHWCHVMEKESFEDRDVAELMNKTVVAIKVDREERPDIDNIYMTACQIMTGSGGWPLNVFITPDKKPFYSATYIPKHSRMGIVGMLELLPKISELWLKHKNRILLSSEQIAAAINETQKEALSGEPDEQTIDSAYNQLSARFDKAYGGFSAPPKFPTPHNLTFLLRYWKQTNNKDALNMAEKSLISIRHGGIFDQIGFGFHRYSTDSEWLVPHFEKMLYDQALLSIAYIEAYQASGNMDFLETFRQIFTYVLRDMTRPDGGFYSGEDADSEGEEGKFYFWTEAEIRKILNKDEAELFIKAFNIRSGGNFTEPGGEDRTGKNIPHLLKSVSELSAEFNIPEKELRNRLEMIRIKLFAARKNRIHPGKDDKILTDWNGLMIAALAKGSRIIDDSSYIQAAKKTVGFILSKMRTADGGLLHRYRDGDAAINANLDDYAFFVWGLLEMYEAEFETQYLKAAIELNDYMLKYFWDDKSGGFFFTPEHGEDLIIRRKIIYDGALPSGNSAAMLNLLRLSHITGNVELEEIAVKIGRAFYSDISNSPSAYTQLMTGLIFLFGHPCEIVIAGKSSDPDAISMLKAVNKKYLPNKIVLFRPTEQINNDITHIASFTKDQIGIHGKTTAYVCQNYRCKEPVTDINKLMEMLNQESGLKTISTEEDV